MNLSLHQKTAEDLARLQGTPGNLPVLVGFDGFVDEILRVVDKRSSHTEFQPVRTITQLSQRVGAAAGKSANLEVVVQQMKLGGNGPIMANAMATFGFPVTYIGNLGYPHIHPVFADFAKKAEVISIADPGHTDALEFEDGKLMLGKIETLQDVNWNNLVQRVGKDRLQNFFAQPFVGLVNWTMITEMSNIWKNVQKEILPNLPKAKRTIFFDLADPEKRLASDIQEALSLIKEFQKYYTVILGLNEKESYEISEVLGRKANSQSDPKVVLDTTAFIQKQLGIDYVVVHPVAFAAVASAQGIFKVDGPFCAKPLITTGAGDHFNSGFCLGILLGLTPEQSILTGVSTSGFYVRSAKSPTIADLIQLLTNWPKQ